MGIILGAIDIWSRTVDRRSISGDSTLLTFGKQAVYFTYDDLTTILHRNNYPIADVPEAERIEGPAENLSSLHHGKKFIDDTTLFRALGFNPNNIFRLDINGFEEADIIFDLNTPWKGGQYDFVFDQGTGEHVFSQGDYFNNIVYMVKLGGTYIANLPANDIGHGFYCYGKDALRDFFTSNGFEEMYLRYVYIGNYLGAFWDYIIETEVDVDMVRQSPLYGIGISAVYRRRAITNAVVPNQREYVAMWRRASTGTVTWVPPSATFMRSLKTGFVRKFPLLGAAVIAVVNTWKILRSGKRVNF